MFRLSHVRARPYEVGFDKPLGDMFNDFAQYWFTHFGQTAHKQNAYAKDTHLSTFMGPLANGNNARFRQRHHGVGGSLSLMNCTAPLCSTQGGSYPTKESVCLEIGDTTFMSTLVLERAARGELWVEL